MEVAESSWTVEPGMSDLYSGLYHKSLLKLGSLSFEEIVSQIIVQASQTFPGAVGAGLVLNHAVAAGTGAVTSPLMAKICTLEERLGEGPGHCSKNSRSTVVSGNLGSDNRWLRFGPRAARLGVNSVLSLPLVGAQVSVGSLNVYALAKDVFDDGARRLGQTFAEQAEVIVNNAQLYRNTLRRIDNLEAALISRSAIDQAIGILISRTGITQQEAFERLKTISRDEHRKVRDVAVALVERARLGASRPIRIHSTTLEEVRSTGAKRESRDQVNLL